MLLDAAELLMLYIDTLSEVVTETYLAERERLVSEEERALRASWSSGSSTATPLTREERELAARLDVPLRDCYVPFAAAIPGASPRRHAALAARLRGEGRLAVTEGDRVFGLALAPPAAADLGEGPQALLATRRRDAARASSRACARSCSCSSTTAAARAARAC